MACEKKKDIIFVIYSDSRTVFRINDIALLLGCVDGLLYQKLNYFVKQGKLLNIRRGIYAKQSYRSEELACILYTPTYISLDYVFQRNGINFQYDSAITNITYQNREIEVDNQIIRYKQIKREILVNPAGILLNQNNINIATPERAFLDQIYLYKNSYFDSLNSLKMEKISQLLPVYNSETFNNNVKKVIDNAKYPPT
ncbi:MAG: type IV toxin-antitoxin system AbiEi family antitoxin domain-containing protein [Paludibacter sp.]|jgi:hypothetical protein|nr:type IV toxin-antitoxin system AbiEi family antitoxin domain-containing protein [Paludibacter sp.]